MVNCANSPLALIVIFHVLSELRTKGDNKRHAQQPAKSKERLQKDERESTAEKRHIKAERMKRK